MEDPSTPAMRWRKRVPTSGLSAFRLLNRSTVSEVKPATFARSTQFIMRFPKGSLAMALAPPADWALPNPPELVFRRPEPASEASVTIMLRSPH